MENLKEPLLEMFTDDPVNWVKWAVVFTVLIGFFILSFKIYGKIEYHLSIRKKADQARAKGHVIENAKRIAVRKKGTYQERKESNKTTYGATYQYTLDGKEKVYRAYFSNNYPPETIDLYYKNSPRKLFSVEEYYWQPHIGILYLALIFMPFVLAGFTGMALDIPFATSSNDNGSTEVADTGAWNTGTIISGPYRVTVTCPEVGHPDPECDWGTWYRDDEEELDLVIQFNFVNPPMNSESMEETVLWGHDVIYETKEIPSRAREDREQELCRAYLELGPDKYLQIDIFGINEVHTPAYKFLEDENFQSSFSLEYVVIQ